MGTHSAAVHKTIDVSGVISDWLIRRAAQTPSAEFCTMYEPGGNTTSITWADLLHGALRYATAYDAHQIPPQSIVIIILKHCADQFYAFLGATLSGRIPSFLAFPSVKQDPQIYWNEHKELLQRIDARILVTYPENIPAMESQVGNLSIPILTPEDLPAQPTTIKPSAASLDDVAFLQHSSGTTGLKKGVALTHRAVFAQLRRYAAALRLETSDRIATWLPLYHDMGLIACFLMPLVTGIPFVAMNPFRWVVDPLMLFEAIEKFACTHAWLPNFAFMHLVRAATLEQARSYALGGMKAFINCSEPCKPDTFDAFLKAFSRYGVRREQLQTCYAMAETVFAVTQSAIGATVRTVEADRDELGKQHRFVSANGSRPARRLLSVGSLLDDFEMQVVSDSGADMPQGHVGEIVVRGPCLFSEYFRQEEITRRKLRDGWYYTGDLGFHMDGELYVLGRKDDVLIANGRNFYAHDIEFFASQVPGVKPGRIAAVDAFNTHTSVQEILVFVEVLTEDSPADDIVRSIRRRIATALDLQVHAVLVPPGWVVKTTSGKVSRKENLRKYLAQSPNSLYETPS